MSEILFHLTQILLIAASVIVMAAAVFHFYCFDRLIRFEFKNHKDQWVKDGKASGFFWQSGESGFWQGGMSRKAAWQNWSKEIPGWIQADPQAMVLLKSMRRSKKNDVSFGRRSRGDMFCLAAFYVGGFWSLNQLKAANKQIEMKERASVVGDE